MKFFSKICKTCRNNLSLSDYYKSNPYVCKECIKSKARREYTKDKNFNNKANRHHIDKDELYGLMCTQGNKCAICNRPERFNNQFGVKSLAIDHDHKTGKIRGLLCSNCNRTLGLFEDNISLLESAKRYLEK